MKLLKGIASLGLVAVAAVAVVGCNSEKPVDKVYSNSGTHTYNQSTSTFPNNWNPFTYQTVTANSLILAYTTGNFYTFDYNEDKTGYQMVNDMAVGEPKDVTDQYVGEEWGISEGDSARAWRVTIRDDIQFEDGTPITAQTLVDSMKALLDPTAQNYRADSAYSGNFVMHNAQKYLYQGKEGIYAADIANDPYDSAKDSEYFFRLGPSTEDEPDAEASIRGSIGFPASYDASMVASYLVSNYLGVAIKDKYGEFEGTVYPALDDAGKSALVATLGSMEGKSFAEIKADSTMYEAWKRLIAWWQTDPNEELDFFVASYTWPKVDFDTVGIQYVDDNTVDYIIDNPLEGFYLKYSFPVFIVHPTIYASCENTSGDVYQNTYGTSVATYSSFGPYKLEYFQADKEIRLVRNEKWYGYVDKEPGPGYYQTDVIKTVYQANSATSLQLFLSGQLDSYGLTEADMSTYQSSPYTYYSTGASTFFVAINPTGDTWGDKALETKEFRQALSFAIDRKAFALACSPMNNPGLALFSNLIVSDPDLGKTYRNEEVAQQVILDFWGLTDQIGEGKRYATAEEAIQAITGIDVQQAQTKFNEAAEILKDAGWNGTDTLEIMIGAPSTSSFYSKGAEVLQSSWNAALKGTALEGKVTFKTNMTLGDNFGDALRQGQVDILFGVGWSGSELDPYGLISAYTDPSYTYDTGIDYGQVMADIHFDSISATPLDESGKPAGDKVTLTDVTLRASALDWSMDGLTSEVQVTLIDGAGNNKQYMVSGNSSAPYEVRVAILAGVESAVLEQYTMLPLLDDSSAQLKGHKINFGTEEYVFGMGFGGIQYYTYNYDDAGWAEYVKDQGGTLDYTN